MIGNSLAAELLKLRGLPAVPATALATVAVAVGTSVAVAPDPVPVAIPFLQIGPILVGVLAAATEHPDRQIRASLTAVPNRPVLLATKTVAALVATVVTGAAAVGAGLVTALLARPAPTRPDLGPAAGAVVYLALIGMLGFAVAVLLRSLIPALVTMLGLVLVAGPLLSAVAAVARYLPDGAGSLLYRPAADAVLTPATGTLVLLGWIVAVGAAASVAFLVRDA